MGLPKMGFPEEEIQVVPGGFRSHTIEWRGGTKYDLEHRGINAVITNKIPDFLNCSVFGGLNRRTYYGYPAVTIKVSPSLDASPGKYEVKGVWRIGDGTRSALDRQYFRVHIIVIKGSKGKQE